MWTRFHLNTHTIRFHPYSQNLQLTHLFFLRGEDFIIGGKCAWRFTADFFTRSQTGSKDLPHSALTNQSTEGAFPWQPTTSTSKTVNYSKICRACSRNHHMRNSRELKQQWRQQLRKRHLKNEFTLLHTSFSIPPRSIRHVLSNLSGAEIIKNVMKYRKRKRKSSSCVHLLYKTWN